MNPEQLSLELRRGETPDLTRRRWIIGLSMVGVGMGALVSLYQTGVIKELPDPPLPLIDSNKVDASNYAYSRLDTPDGFMMVINYGITALLAGAGGINRTKEHPWLPIAMAGKVLTDCLVSLELAREEWSENKAFCAYCQVATLSSLASLALCLPELLTAVQALSDRSHESE